MSIQSLYEKLRNYNNNNPHPQEHNEDVITNKEYNGSIRKFCTENDTLVLEPILQAEAELKFKEFLARGGQIRYGKYYAGQLHSGKAMVLDRDAVKRRILPPTVYRKKYPNG
jgi:hypothetical protein